MVREGYISVTDAAKILGISRQTIHNRLKADRYRYQSVVTGKQERYEILEEDILAEVGEQGNGYQVDINYEQLDSPQVADLSRYLWTTLELVEKQITGRDQIISTLTAQLDRKDRTIERLQDAIVKLAERRNEKQPSWWQRLWS